MPKHDFLTPKAIANRIKAKGLQKLRWYCQLCNKQCRDENGFKCHQGSEGHKRLMMVFGQGPEKFVDGYSELFEQNFLHQLKISHPHSRVRANDFYQDVIKDKHHIHMNSTKWLTLSDFVIYLGRTGKCIVEYTERGWFITLIYHDMKSSDYEQVKIKRKEACLSAEKLKLRELAEQVRRAKEIGSANVDEEGPVYSNDNTELVENKSTKSVNFQLLPLFCEEHKSLSHNVVNQRMNMKKDSLDFDRAINPLESCKSSITIDNNIVLENERKNQIQNNI